MLVYHTTTHVEYISLAEFVKRWHFGMGKASPYSVAKMELKTIKKTRILRSRRDWEQDP